MEITKKKDNDETAEFWTFVETTAQEVRKWPLWMRGGEPDLHEKVSNHKSAKEKSNEAGTGVCYRLD